MDARRLFRTWRCSVTRLPRSFRLWILALLLACFSGCEAQQALQELANKAKNATAAPAAPVESVPAATVESIPAPAATAGETIRIASFNIQVFGMSKLRKPDVMDVLAQVVRRFDVVAIQEVRSKDQSVLPQFTALVNADGAHYDYVLGPRLGRTSSKEQYAIMFDTTRIEADRSSVYTAADPQDLLHREPMVARFRVLGLPAEQAFTFTLVDIHTDPDETTTELDALADVFLAVQGNNSGEDDVILLGDLNVDEYHLGRLGRLPGIAWVVSDVTTNTRRTKSYDNLVFNRQATAEYTGRWGVMNLMDEYGLSEAQALKVSDHLPVWAEFGTREGRFGGPIATRPVIKPR